MHTIQAVLQSEVCPTNTTKDKKRRKMSESSEDSDGYSADPEDMARQYSHLRSVSYLTASSTWREHIGCFISAYMDPGSGHPHVRNMGGTATPDPSLGQHVKFTKYKQDEDVFKDMLHFLYGGDNDRIIRSEQFVSEWQDDINNKWILQFLGILDSSPAPHSNSHQDCAKWKGDLLQRVRALDVYGEKYITMSSIIDDLEKLARDSGDVCDNNPRNALWRNVLQALITGILAPAFSAFLVRYRGKFEGVGVMNKGLCECRIDFTKYYETGEYAPAALKSASRKAGGKVLVRHEQSASRKAGGKVLVRHERLCSNYCVTVRPDLVLLKSVCKYSQLMFFTIKVGAWNIDINEPFQTVHTEPGISTHPSEEPQDREGLGMDSKITVDNSSDSGSSSGPDKSRKATSLDHLPSIMREVYDQHLLELMGLALRNKETLIECDLVRCLRKLNVLSTAGLLWFNNAMFLTRLDADIVSLDGKEHKHTKCGKYIFCDKFLDPWNGHWTTISKYLLACYNHIMEHPEEVTDP